MEDVQMKIVVIISAMGNDALCELGGLPSTAQVLGSGTCLQDLIEKDVPLDEANILLNQIPSTENVKLVIEQMPSLRWVHSMPSGIEYLQIPALTSNPSIILSRSRGIFAPQLAEYVLCACLYFAKQAPRLLEQQLRRMWSPFSVSELREKSIGIVGYGDIGVEVARRAKAFGMHVHALRRQHELLKYDRLVDVSYGMHQLHDIVAVCDYIIILLPLTNSTRGIINKDVFRVAKNGQVFINIARGPVVDEEALIEALGSNGNLSAAALDVFAVEPLPATSPLWSMKNVLISPHCMFRVDNTLHEGVKYFVHNCHRYAKGELLSGIVDKDSGY